MPLTPNNREEHFFKGMVDGSTTLTPNNRKEHWYSEIIDAIGSGGGGGGGGAMVITGTVSAGGSHVTLDKTWKEIFDAMTSGIVPVVMWDEVAGDDTYKYREPVDCANESAGQYNVHTYNGDFFTDTENGYPDMYRD